MTSSAYFAPAFRSDTAADSLPSASNAMTRKRKRHPTVSENDSNSHKREMLPSDGELETLSTIVVGREFLGQDAAAQSEVSGQSFDNSFPGGRFPHEFPRRRSGSVQLKARSDLSDEVESHRPPLFIASELRSSIGATSSGTVGLRQQHLVAMTSLLQKSVFEGDYIRAGRAWSMLLRTEYNGHSLDLRTNGLWGLGAEIILKRGALLAHSRREGESTFATHGTDEHQNPYQRLGLQGFDQAKEYYERLVLQYPYRKAFPDTVGPQEFYIAMFSLWIYSVNKQHSSALADIENQAANDKDTYAEAYRNTLQRANDIAVRLQELLISPPYSDNIRYTHLYSMLKEWISDISNADDGPRNDSGHEDTLSESSST